MGIKILLTLSLAVMIATGNNAPTEAKDTYICEEYQQYIYEVSEEYDVCPELIMAIVERESSGKADAVNGNCKGLMQVSQRWHADRMERLGVTDLYDPYGNILVGTDYFVELTERYGEIGYVLMKYNGDSRADSYAEGKCELSKYAQDVLTRTEELKRAHRKRVKREDGNRNEGWSNPYEKLRQRAIQHP